MARRGENIYRRKDGRWEGRYITGRREDGKPIFRSVYGLTYTSVKELLARHKGDDSGHIDRKSHKPETRFDDWAQYWLEMIARPIVRMSTYQNYRRIVENHLIPALGAKELQSVSDGEIQTLVCKWSNRLAPGTVQGLLRVLKCIMGRAQQRGLCQIPVWSQRVTGRSKRSRVLSVAEQRCLERTVSESDGLEYVLCLYSGLRLGELCALRWHDVDLNNRTLNVRNTLQRVQVSPGRTKIVMGKPKSDSSEREVPVPTFVAALMRDHRRRQPDSEFVFERRGGRPLDPRTVQARFARLTARLGIHGAHIHTLRHTYATRCLERQVGCEVLSELLGHSSPQVTWKFYAHCTSEQKLRSVDRLRLLA